MHTRGPPLQSHDQRKNIEKKIFYILIKIEPFASTYTFEINLKKISHLTFVYQFANMKQKERQNSVRSERVLAFLSSFVLVCCKNVLETTLPKHLCCTRNAGAKI